MKLKLHLKDCNIWNSNITLVFYANTFVNLFILVISLSRRSFFQYLKPKDFRSVKCTAIIVFGSQYDLSFSRLVFKTKRPVFKTKRHTVLIALKNLSLLFKTTCENKIELFKIMCFGAQVVILEIFDWLVKCR